MSTIVIPEDGHDPQVGAFIEAFRHKMMVSSSFLIVHIHYNGDKTASAPASHTSMRLAEHGKFTSAYVFDDDEEKEEQEEEQEEGEEEQEEEEGRKEEGQKEEEEEEEEQEEEVKSVP